MSNGSMHTPSPAPRSGGLSGATLPSDFRDNEGPSGVAQEQISVRDIVSTETILKLVAAHDFVGCGVESGLHEIARSVIQESPELRELYSRVKSGQTFQDIFTAVVTLGFRATPAQQVETEVCRALTATLRQLHELGLVVLCENRTFSVLPVGARGGVIDANPITVTSVTITEAGRRALAETASH
jgi:hypothetical protein